MELVNRVVVSPMAKYLAQDGLPGDWHLVHYGARALGGAGLVFTEMTCVSPDARITPGCAGLWNEAQQDAWKRIVDFVHRHSPAKIALQLGHAGRKGSTQLGWQEMDDPLPAGNWPLISASAAAVFRRRQPDAPRDDGGRFCARYRRIRPRRANRRRGRLRHARAAHGARLSAREFSLAAHQPAPR